MKISPTFKLQLLPNSFIESIFTWYATLPRNFILSWQEIERHFHILLFRAKPEVCIVELSWDTTELFISIFKKRRNRCKIHLLEMEYVKMAQRGLDIELRKKFQGMKFKDFNELVAKVTKYEESLKEESYQKKKSMGTYC